MGQVSPHMHLNSVKNKAPREVRRDRVQTRNKIKGTTFSIKIPEHIFEMASNMWEPIDELEYHWHEIKFISTQY